MWFVTFRLCLLVCAVLIEAHAGTRLVAQTQPTSYTFSRVATFQHETSAFPLIVERADGSLFVADRRERTIVNVLPDATIKAVVLRYGDGPGEYRGVHQLLTKKGDTTLVTDAVTHRVIVLAGTVPVRTISKDDRPWNNVMSLLVGHDSVGRLYGLVGRKSKEKAGIHRPSPSDFSMSDTGALVVLAPGEVEPRELFRLRGGSAAMTYVRRNVRGQQILYELRSPFERADAVAVCADGAILHVASNAGLVRWVNKSQIVSVSSGLFARPAVTDAHKRQAITLAFGPEFGKLFLPKDYPPWPERLPAFSDNGVWCLSDGDGLLEGEPDERGSRRYFRVSRRGDVQLVVGAPAGARIAAVGRNSVYFAAKSDDGLYTISKHRLQLSSGDARQRAGN